MFDPEDRIAWAANPPPNGDRAIGVGGRAVGCIRQQKENMPAAYSIDLRTKILEADGNKQCLQRQIAARFSVLIQVKATGSHRLRGFHQPLRY
jgi:hypothetical protein